MNKHLIKTKILEGREEKSIGLIKSIKLWILQTEFIGTMQTPKM